EWIEQYQKVIVNWKSVEVVAVGQVRTDLRGIWIEGVAPNIEIAGIVGDPAVGLHRRRRIIPGEPLVENRNPGRILPRGFVEPAVNVDRSGGRTDLVGCGGRKPALRGLGCLGGGRPCREQHTG